MFVLSRIEFYKMSDCSSVFAESERKLARYDNPDWDPSKVSENVHLVAPAFSGGIDAYILSKKCEYKCRMSVDQSLPIEKQTNVLGQALFSASPEFFDGLSRQSVIEYFVRCLQFFTDNYPTAEVVSAVVHFDETTPHLHLNFLPVVERVNNKGVRKKVFSSSSLFPGKNAFAEYQDAFYDQMCVYYPSRQLQRKGEESRPHLTVQEFKDLRDQNKPSLQLKVVNAELKRQVSVCRDCLQYLLNMFPQLEPIYRKFFGRSGVKNLER